MTAPRLIGLAGRARSGKDTVARILDTEHGFAKLAFAAPIKDALVAMFGINRADLENGDKEAPIPWLGVSIRELMQTLGTAWGRDMVRTDLWILQTERRLAQVRRYAPQIVITDVRFPNEAAWIRAQGGEIWHILRDQPSGSVRDHVSESGIAVEGADSIIHNDASLWALTYHVVGALRGLFVVDRLDSLDMLTRFES